MVKIISMDDWRLRVVTPICVTSCGSRPSAAVTRFCTFTCAMSGSVPWLK